MTNSTIQQLGDAFYTAMFEAWQAEGAAIIAASGGRIPQCTSS